MKYAIIENERVSLESLRQKVESVRRGYELTFTAESVEEAVEYFSGQPEAELVFMDIELVDGNCFDIFEQVEVKSYIIFTTAYDEYAIRAFKVNSVDYLLKPITEDAVRTAIDKLERMQGATRMDYRRLGEEVHKRKPRRRLLLMSGDNYFYEELGNVSYFLSEEKYVYAVLLSGRRRMTEFKNLTEAEELLRGADFFQVSRNILASINSISKVSRFFNGRLKVIVKAGDEEQEVVVSAARRKQFLDWMGDNQ